MSQALASFDPFALHPFTSVKPLQPAQAQQFPKQNRQSPATPPGGYVPQAPVYSQPPPRQQSASTSTKHVFDIYKADGRRTPDLAEILNKNGGQKWN
ncbi:hypothetical protein FRB96_001644 [Tulasnella sp. 330]|nr:hypothetical protein FRB96_001644 [Tulasnella sp. 330]KAG8883569.1 hypothetical protein FRB98_003068 [Tulasnella sp. 332]